MEQLSITDKFGKEILLLDILDYFIEIKLNKRMKSFHFDTNYWNDLYLKALALVNEKAIYIAKDIKNKNIIFYARDIAGLRAKAELIKLKYIVYKFSEKQMCYQIYVINA
jgi:hypothetical protein